MFAPAPAIIRGYHVTALHNAYGLMAAAAESGKPHACWAHHMSVGGAKVADQLVALGYFVRRLDARPGEVETYRYRITAEGCAYISQPYLVEDLSMFDQTHDVEQTSPADSVDLSYPPKDPQPQGDATFNHELAESKARPSASFRIVEPVTPDGAWLRSQAADTLHDLTPGEAQLLASIHDAGGKLKVPYSQDRVSITKKGLIVLMHRTAMDASPLVELTPLGEAAAALQAEMRVPEDDEEAPSPLEGEGVGGEGLPAEPADEDNTVDEDALCQRFTYKRGDRVRYGDQIGTVDSTDVYPFVLFEADSDRKLIKVSENLLFQHDDAVETPAVDADPEPSRDTQELPAITDADEIADLRADRDALIEQQLDMERQIVTLRDQLAAIKSALADKDGALPDDPAATIAALKLHVSDQQATIDTQHAAILNMRAQIEAAEQERDEMKRDVTSLKLQIASMADSGGMGIQHDWTFSTSPADITARTLAGWTPWHKEFSATEGLIVVWERRPDQKPARRNHERTQVTGPAAPAYTPRPAPVSGGVLQPSAIIDPAEPEPAPLTAMSAVMSSFTRNLQAQFESNPIPQFSVTPGAKQPDLPAR